VVSQDTTSLSTTPNVTTITLSAATPPVLTDTAVLSGGYSPTGTITFTLVNNGNTVDTETSLSSMATAPTRRQRATPCRRRAP